MPFFPCGLRMIDIRRAVPEDFAQILPIFRDVIEGGDTYDFEESVSDQEVYDYWFGPGDTSFVVERDGQVIGFYKVVANRRGRGSHVANVSIMIASHARGKGIGRMTMKHCMEQARAMGFKAIQANFVVSTNAPAIHLWKSLGFKELCRLPKAFNHKEFGYVDAMIFFLELS